MTYDCRNPHYAELWIARERANIRTRDCVDTRAEQPGSYAYNLAAAVRKLRHLLACGAGIYFSTTWLVEDE